MMFSNLEIILATALSCIGLYLAYRGLVLKIGRAKIRGEYTQCSSIACDDKYISSVTLENVRDRAITIFAIYLKFGFDLYVEIDNFEDAPLILGPFESFRKEYGPIEFYSTGTRRILINDLFADKSVKKRLVLSTSDGKYTVRRLIPTWDPVTEFFRNYMTGIAHPIRSTFKGKAYGSSTLYLVELELSDGTSQVLPIYPRDHEGRRFKRFQLTRECLETKATLESFLDQQREQGNLPVSSITVHDLRASREERFKDDATKEPLQGKPDGIFKYYVLGWIYTRISRWDTRRKGKQRARLRQQKDRQVSSEGAQDVPPEGPPS